MCRLRVHLVCLLGLSNLRFVLCCQRPERGLGVWVLRILAMFAPAIGRHCTRASLDTTSMPGIVAHTPVRKYTTHPPWER